MGDAGTYKHNFALLFRNSHLGRARFDVRATTSLETERTVAEKEVNAQFSTLPI